MAGIRIEGNISGNCVEVTAANELCTTGGSATEAGAGFSTIVCEGDPGTLRGGARYMKAPEADEDYRLRVGQDSLVFQETWAGAALNSAQWTAPVTTFAVAVSNAYCKLNSGASAAANGVARVQSYRTFSLEHSFALYIEFPMQIVAAALGILNTTVEAGWFIASGTAAPTDGVFLRWNAAGELRLVSSYNGAETQSNAIDQSFLATNSAFEVLLVINTIEAELWIDNQLVTTVDRSTSTPSLSVSTALPITYRVYNGAVAPASATQVWIGPPVVSRGGVCNPADMRDTSALCGWGAYQGQSGGTMGYTANSANSAAPASAALSNTTAGYTTLGGQWQFAALAGAETDYALFAFQVPAMAAGSFNKNLVIRRIRIEAMNAGAAVATTATAMAWQIGVGATAVTLATVADTSTAKQSRRIPIGVQSFLVGDAIGKKADPIDVAFDAPLVCEPGTYVHVIMKQFIGTATASQIIRGTVMINGQFE
jgi:hypothetical protein